MRHRGDAGKEGAVQIETLREFISVVRHGSITSAAKALYMSQPALSKHIAALEREVGQKLFFDTQPLITTEAGRIVMEYASKVVALTETTDLQLAAMRGSELELIRMQSLTFFEALHNEAQFFKGEIKKKFPGVTFDVVRCKPYQNPLESLAAGHIDIGFQFNIVDKLFEMPQLPEEYAGRFIAIPLYGYTGELRLGVRKDSPLLAKNKRLHLADFADAQFFGMATNLYDSLISDFRRICIGEGFSPQIQFVTTESNQDFWTRDYGDGVLLLDVVDCENFTTADEHLMRTYQPIRPFDDGRKLYITITLYARDEQHGPALTHFLEHAMETTEQRREIMVKTGRPIWFGTKHRTQPQDGDAKSTQDSVENAL